jgi:Serine dehydrogenase proteinase
VANRGQDSNSVIETLLHERLTVLEGVVNGDVLAYFGPIIDPAHDLLRVAIDDLDEHRRDKLVVVLETDGGFAESAERLQRAFRHNYSTVDFIVPGYAMSAGTILVMSGDNILMDYSSVLGPIDPQVRRGEDRSVSALGYIEKYDGLIKKADAGTLNTAEMMYLVQNFDPGDLSQYEHARDLSIALLKAWLVRFKFKNWTITETRRLPVTPAMKSLRAQAIARALSNTKKWHSHGRGIPMDVLIKDINIKIDDFGADPALNTAVRDYYVLLKDYMMRRGHQIVWQTRRGHNGA